MTIQTTRIKSDLPERIKKQRRRVNGGLNVEIDYPELRRLQKMLTDELVIAANNAAIRVQPATLRLLNKMDFPIGQTIKVGKYVIDFNRLKTRSWNAETFWDLQSKDMPQYLRRFMGI